MRLALRWLVDSSNFVAVRSPETGAAPEPSSSTSHDSAPPAQPDGAYLLLAGVYIATTAGAWLWLRRRRLTWPKPEFFDFVLLGLGTARLSRLITRDKIMLPLRAPLTASTAEGDEPARGRPHGSGLVRAAGELVTCPRCAAVWAASGLTLTYFASPTSARFAGLLLSSSLISDFTNRAFALLNEAKLSKEVKAQELSAGA